MTAPIRVGPRRYRVVVDRPAIDRASTERGDELVGRCDNERQTITLSPDLGPDMHAETLLHEVLHAATHLAGLDAELGAKREEKVVNRLAPILLDLLRRNPKLLDELIG